MPVVSLVFILFPTLVTLGCKKEGKTARKLMRASKREGETLTFYLLTNVMYVLPAVTGKQEVGEEELRLLQTCTQLI